MQIIFSDLCVPQQPASIDVDKKVPYSSKGATEADSSWVAKPSIMEVSLGSQPLDTAIAGSVAKSYIGDQKLELEAEVNSRNLRAAQRDREPEWEVPGLSLAEDGASTRALAGSLLAYRIEKMENTSVDTQCSTILDHLRMLISKLTC